MYPAALHTISTQSVDSSQVLERRILQRQTNIFNKLTKTWDKKTMGNLEQDCPKQVHESQS